MKIGAHVSIAGGIPNAPLRAAKMGCEVFQMFSRSPHGGKKQEITPELADEFQSNMRQAGIEECYIHAPYFINLGSTNNRIYYGSISTLRDELERGSKLGVTYMMFHPGSGKDAGRKKGLDLVVKGIDKILDGYDGSCELLIENSAGAGEILCDTFEEIAYVLKNIKRPKDVGICFDTCHAFASGYDLRTNKDVNRVIKDFDKIIGLEKLKMFQFNDSKIELNGKKDRHEVIGQGFIGEECFFALLHHPKLKHVNGALETPDLRTADPASLKTLQKLRKMKSFPKKK